MKFGTTHRGFLLGEFRDRYGQQCSIQESSLATESCIWLGVDVGLDGVPVEHGRMHLTQEMAKALIPVLRHFAREGSLGVDSAEDPLSVGRFVVGVAPENRGVEGRVTYIDGSTWGVQDLARSGPSGRHTGVLSTLNLLWEPIDAPDEVRSRYDRLSETEEESDVGLEIERPDDAESDPPE